MDSRTKRLFEKVEKDGAFEIFADVFGVEEVEYQYERDSISWESGRGWQRGGLVACADGYRYTLGRGGVVHESMEDAVLEAFMDFELDTYISDYGLVDCTFELDDRWKAGNILISEEALTQLLYIDGTSNRCEVLELAVHAAKELNEQVITRRFIKLAQEAKQLVKFLEAR